MRGRPPKLSPAEAASITASWLKGAMTQVELAETYNVSQGTISRTIARQLTRSNN